MLTKETKTLDNSTTAAFPGGITVSAKKYAEYYGTSSADIWLNWTCTFLPWSARHWPWVGNRVYHWTRIQEHFEQGCIVPAVVLDSKRGLIAVYSSLTAIGEQSTPVVKIQHERLDLIDSLPTTNGSRFAAVSIYSQTEESMEEGLWSDFFPIIVDCLSEDYRSCRNAVTRIRPFAWEALEIGIQQLGKIQKIGLYDVDVPDEIADGAF